MKPLISPEYAELNRQLHAEMEEYGAKGHEAAAVIARGALANGYKVILDFGCGKGTLKPALKRLSPNLQVIEYDPAVKTKDKLPAVKPDLIVALDVMEHIEPAYLSTVLETMAALNPQAVMLMIALEPANKTLPDGRNAHLIVESAAWWRERLSQDFIELSGKVSKAHFLFVGQPRKGKT